MVSPVIRAAMIGTIYFLRANCAQHGGKASGGGLISASLLSYRALDKRIGSIFFWKFIQGCHEILIFEFKDIFRTHSCVTIFRSYATLRTYLPICLVYFKRFVGAKTVLLHWCVDIQSKTCRTQLQRLTERKRGKRKRERKRERAGEERSQRYT